LSGRSRKLDGGSRQRFPRLEIRCGSDTVFENVRSARSCGEPKVATFSFNFLGDLNRRLSVAIGGVSDKIKRPDGNNLFAADLASLLSQREIEKEREKRRG